MNNTTEGFTSYITREEESEKYYKRNCSIQHHAFAQKKKGKKKAGFEWQALGI